MDNMKRMTRDEKVQDIALAYIRKHAMDKPWERTVMGELHPYIGKRLQLEQGELVVVSAYFSEDSWYAFTTRRIVSKFGGTFYSIDPSAGISGNFGIFKGGGGKSREVATLTPQCSDQVIKFEFVTGAESMLPIYAERYWNIKHRALDKLVTSAERQEITRRRRVEGQ